MVAIGVLKDEDLTCEYSHNSSLATSNFFNSNHDRGVCMESD